jgi:hypothetical protein
VFVTHALAQKGEQHGEADKKEGFGEFIAAVGVDFGA